MSVENFSQAVLVVTVVGAALVGCGGPDTVVVPAPQQQPGQTTVVTPGQAPATTVVQPAPAAAPVQKVEVDD